MTDLIPLTISGVEFTVDRRYVVGHVCTAAEAQVLQRQLQDNLRDGFAKRVKETAASSPPDWSRLHEEFRQFEQEYQFGAVAGRDAVSRIAKHLAEAVVKEWLNREGKRIVDLPEGDYAKRVKDAAELPAVRAEAGRRLAALSKLAEEALA